MRYQIFRDLPVWLLVPLLLMACSDSLPTGQDIKNSRDGGSTRDVDGGRRDTEAGQAGPDAGEEGLWHLTNDFTTLTINRSGHAVFLSNGVQQLLAATGPLSWITLRGDEQRHEVERLESVGPELFELTYGDCDFKATLRIVPEGGTFVFTLEAMSGASKPQVERLVFLDLQTLHQAQRPEQRDWAEGAAAAEIFLMAVPLDVNTVCRPLAGGYRCSANRWMGLTSSSGALVTAPKGEYSAQLEALILAHALPRVEVDGKWLRRSAWHRKSYLFFPFLNDQIQVCGQPHGRIVKLKDWAIIGGFEQVLFQHLFRQGSYDEPIYLDTFGGMSEFINTVQGFRDDGLAVGIHGYFGQISDADAAFNSADLSNLLQVPVAVLSEALHPGDDAVAVNQNAEEHEVFKHYVKYDWTEVTRHYFLIEGEILLCGVENRTGQPQVVESLIDCEHGISGTAAAIHAPSATVHLLPFTSGYRGPDKTKERRGYWLAPDAVSTSAQSFAGLANQLQPSFLYFDNYSYLPPPGMKDEADHLAFQFQRGIWPYLNALNTPLPIQTGVGAVGAYGWFFLNRNATWDGFEYRSKEFTRNFKVDKILQDNPYGDWLHELGWWKIHGANVSTGAGDVEVLSSDDVHYMMSKAIGLERGAGVQFGGIHWKEHCRLNEIFGLMGRYHALIKQDIDQPFIPAAVKEYLRIPDNEAVLVKTSTAYHMKKKRRVQEVARWDPGDPFLMSAENPFGAQALNVEIRPAFDFYAENDSSADHLLLANYSSLLIEEPIPDSDADSPSVICSWNKGVLTIMNQTGTVAGCKVKPRDEVGFKDLSHHRGLALNVTGTGDSSVVVVHLTHSGSSAFRDYVLDLDFTGNKTLVLDRPTTTRDDPMGRVDSWANPKWRYSTTYRSAEFDWSAVRVAVYFFALPGTHKVTLHALRALQEKPDNRIVNPSITVGGTTLQLTGTLSTAPGQAYRLHYNGYNDTAQWYTAQDLLLATSSVESPDKLMNGPGINTLRISASTSNPDDSRQARVVVTFYDDEDNDGVPTDGDFSPGVHPCVGAESSFCDDNCPQHPNPQQGPCP